MLISKKINICIYGILSIRHLFLEGIKCLVFRLTKHTILPFLPLLFQLEMQYEQVLSTTVHPRVHYACHPEAHQVSNTH